jgi:hypothetical protein
MFVLFDHVWIVWCVYVVLILYYSFVRRATCLVERSEGIVIFTKASNTHIFYLLFTTALVFSVVCMIGGIIKTIL